MEKDVEEQPRELRVYDLVQASNYVLWKTYQLQQTIYKIPFLSDFIKHEWYGKNKILGLNKDRYLYQLTLDGDRDLHVQPVKDQPIISFSINQDDDKRDDSGNARFVALLTADGSIYIKALEFLTHSEKLVFLAQIEVTDTNRLSFYGNTVAIWQGKNVTEARYEKPEKLDINRKKSVKLIHFDAMVLDLITTLQEPIQATEASPYQMIPDFSRTQHWKHDIYWPGFLKEKCTEILRMSRTLITLILLAGMVMWPLYKLTTKFVRIELK